MNDTFWTDKQVIVTGGAGFLGSYVVAELNKREAAQMIVLHQGRGDLRQLSAVQCLLGDLRTEAETTGQQTLVIHQQFSG